MGKALGIDEAQIERLAKVMGHFEFRDEHDAAEASLDGRARSRLDRVRTFAKLWHEMQDLPRHLGQHSGGMVICQGRLDAVVRSKTPACPRRVVVQWDKDDCADMGIVKVDLLGLGMMAPFRTR